MRRVFCPKYSVLAQPTCRTVNSATLNDHQETDMPRYALGEQEPKIDPSAFVHPDAVLIGDVRVGPQSSIWPGAVLRGDRGAIIIGAVGVDEWRKRKS